MHVSELIAVDGSALAAVHEAVAGYFGLRLGEPVNVQRVFYDTFDGRLAGAGMVLAREREDQGLAGEALILTLPDGTRLLQALPWPARPRLFAGQLAPGAVRDALAPVTEVRAILEVARVELKAQAIAVVDELEKTVVRLEVEEPEGLFGRIRVDGLRGYDRERGQVTELLHAHPDIRDPDGTLMSEAVRVAGGDPDGVSSAVAVALDRSEAADQAASRVLTRLQEVMDANKPGALEDIDIEFLHDYRVALRRTRAVVRELKGVFPGGRLGHYRAELKWLQGATGPTRDLDVHLDDLAPSGSLWEMVPEQLRAELSPLIDVLTERRRQARQEMAAALGSERAELLRWQWTRLLDMLALLPLGDRPDAKRPLGELASKRIRKVHRRMVRMGEAITPESPPKEYHELRKKGKELRYLLELFGRPLYDPDAVEPLVKSLKRLQDILGRHQDREVQIQALRSAIDVVVAREGGSDALLAIGALIGKLEEDAAAARAEFHQRFLEFASKHQRQLVKDTFSDD